MFKKLFLAGAVIFAGSAMATQTAEAHGPYGSSRSFGSSYRTFGPSYRSFSSSSRSFGPSYRSAGRGFVAPVPVYRSPRVYSAYPQYNYGHGFAPPVYQSYRPSVGLGVGNFGYPAYGPAFGTPRGFSLYIGR